MICLSNVQEISNNLTIEKKVKLFIKRDDQIHETISGNKYRKLVYALNKFKNDKVKTILTFGGAYSNHIHAFSYAAKINGFNSIGIIRGEELKNKELNKTLSFAKENGMKLIFVSREEYKKRNDNNYLNYLKNKYQCEIIPEGGTQYYSKFGLRDLVLELEEQVINFNYVVNAVGTGGTISGIVSYLDEFKKSIGIMVLKGIENDTIKTINKFTNKKNYKLIDDYHFGGYAKYNDELINFIKMFKELYKIDLEQVYTGKAMYALFDLIKSDYFEKGSKIVFIHTGGLQGSILKKD